MHCFTFFVYCHSNVKTPFFLFSLIMCASLEMGVFIMTVASLLKFFSFIFVFMCIFSLMFFFYLRQGDASMSIIFVCHDS